MIAPVPWPTADADLPPLVYVRNDDDDAWAIIDAADDEDRRWRTERLETPVRVHPRAALRTCRSHAPGHCADWRVVRTALALPSTLVLLRGVTGNRVHVVFLPDSDPARGRPRRGPGTAETAGISDVAVATESVWWTHHPRFFDQARTLLPPVVRDGVTGPLMRLHTDGIARIGRWLAHVDIHPGRRTPCSADAEDGRR